ncbi:unnamed protein product [Psylliodes chrysocephalus]|uniref:Glucose-methanol-choline oxidoreductase N-terminal domain-containing protein n=1 Tax=Psylliodes chrysocephalus TaxID=3402493 RepID=A0A9P0GGR9_9CUCU|nr:unnamed protein product [Psylliodes chrysocephala]
MFFNNQSILLLLYTFCIFLFGCFIRYLEYSDFFLCYNCQEVDSPETLFDYIVVGCGSAGSIVARRLAENKKIRVLLLEAGNHGNSLLDIPSFGLLLQQTPFDWQYTSVPQKRSCLSLHNNASIWPMGKMVGGTGMLNNMIYVRGHPEDFNNWFKEKEGYSFKEYVLPYFKKVEKWTHESDYGSVYISNLSFSTKLSSYVLKAAKELNFDITQHTENCEEGFGLPKINSINGQRWTPANMLLKKGTPNIILRTKRIVEKILFHNNFEAYGVKYSYLGDTYIARASKGVILSAGKYFATF